MSSSRLAVNQLQLSVALHQDSNQVFMLIWKIVQAALRDGSIFEYCKLHDVVIQAWSGLTIRVFQREFCWK